MSLVLAEVERNTNNATENSSTALLEQEYICPFCGTNVSVLIDPTIREQNYIEDCERCCRPIEFSILTNGVHLLSFNYQGLEQ
ncbi:MAG: CPXCG motif-containing cysteine-rich protein [Vicingaceae bacterium]